MSEVLIRNYNSVATSETRKLILDSVKDAFEYLDPEKVTERYLQSASFDKSRYSKLRVFGFGKAALGMVRGIRSYLGYLPEGSAIIVPKGLDVPPGLTNVRILRGSHPVLDEDSIRSTSDILSDLKDLQPDDQVIVLISGGGSALFELPVDGISARDLGLISKCAMNNGADIIELNTIRQSLSQVKGGKLALKLSPAAVTSLIVSDVPGDDPSIIASGPLVPPSVTGERRGMIIDKYSKMCPDLSRVRPRIDTRTLGGDDPVFSRVSNSIILRNQDFVQFIAGYLERHGKRVKALREPVVGDVRDAAEIIVKETLKFQQQVGGPVFIVGGGETTVQVRGKGTGGRNTELSVRVAQSFGADSDFTFASLGTDGIDGVSPAMGGITDRSFIHEASDTIPEYLSNNDTYTLLSRFNSAIITGFTGNNVSDIFICYYNGRV